MFFQGGKMKKIIVLCMSMVLIIGLVAGGTWAYFSDTETSNNNSLTAGTLDLKINNADANYTILNIASAFPGDSGSSNTSIKNSGSVTGKLVVASSNVTNTGGTSGEFGDSVGNLGSQATLALWLDVNQNDTFDTGDIGLKSDGTTYSPSTLNYAVIDSYGGKTWDPSGNGVENMATNAQNNFVMSWQVPTSADNTIQGDSANISFTFTLKQLSMP
jgi:spore coat-associated protein N